MILAPYIPNRVLSIGDLSNLSNLCITDRRTRPE
jgi:hypothetical protein